MKKRSPYKRTLLGVSLLTLLLLLAAMTFTATSQARSLAEDATPGAEQTTPAATAPATEAPTQATQAAQPGAHSLMPADIGSDDYVDSMDDLSTAELDQLRAIGAGALSPQQLAQVKQVAIDKLGEYGPLVVDKLNEKANRKQEQRLFWIGIIMIGIIPLLGFLLFMAYPLVRRKVLAQRAPHAKMGRVYGLYLPQAFMVWVMLLGLGAGLWGIQFLTGRVLGGVTNPQLVFQREAVNYIIDNREALINDYTEMMVGVADDIMKSDPETPVVDVILQNALQLKNDPLVNTTYNIVQFVMPFLSYMSLISYGLLLLFFLIRIRPEIVKLLNYPIEVLAAEETGGNLPDYESASSGLIRAEANPNSTVRRIGAALLKTEVKVIAVFALAVLAVAVVMSFALVLFFNPVVGYLVDNIFLAAQHFLTEENAASALVYSTVLLLVFVVECVAVFLLAFVFALAKLQVALRFRFGGQITTPQTRTSMIRIGLRFGWLLFLLAAFGMGLPFALDKLDDVLYSPTDKDINWTLILFANPIALLIALNLGLFLLRGFRMIGRLLLKSPLADLGLLPPKPPKKGKKAEPASVA